MVKAEVKTNQKKEGTTFSDLYLISYNGIQTIGWSYLLYQLAGHYLTSSERSLYDTVKCTVAVFQNAAVLEVVHAATGLVRSDPIITAFQVASRVLVVCGVLMATASARESIGLSLALLAWCVTEIIRYSLYTLTIVGSVPHFLKYLRYTLFIGLYPLGITGELLCLYAAQREVGDGKLYSILMPNKYNFIFNYQHVLIFIMLLYIPLFPQLYLHMFSQRKKALGKTKKAN
ncbi:unnamed protein product [Phaedon cochleariae]|uniref:Very-long-chain (3R)-3-hydroxyacyl-CoA dehydratase n=1 Tax=Phaedon cochleariae TaxID=80249 RepID=A0A9P0DWD3_PHACE|nr:unnamed protein product [Phaedon cochleariae]